MTLLEDAYRKNIDSLKAEKDDAETCLDLVREALVQHGVQMEKSPPMLYPEAIHNLFIWGIKAGQECLKNHGIQSQEHQVKCISDWIAKHQAKGE